MDDDPGFIPIIEAAKRGNDDLIKEYVEEGQDPKKVDHLGNNALHWAASGNHADVIRQLLALGVDPNVQNKDGDTPLHIAAWRNYTDAAEALTQDGASEKARHLRNGSGKRPIDLAKNVTMKKLVAPRLTMEDVERERKEKEERDK